MVLRIRISSRRNCCEPDTFCFSIPLSYCTAHRLSFPVSQLSQTAVLHSILLSSRGHSAADNIWKTADILFAPWHADIEKERERDTEGSDTDLGLNLDSANITETTATPPPEASPVPVSVPVSESVPVSVPVSEPASESPSDESSSPLNIVLSGASWLFQGTQQDLGQGLGLGDSENIAIAEAEQVTGTEPHQASAKEE